MARRLKDIAVDNIVPRPGRYSRLPIIIGGDDRVLLVKVQIPSGEAAPRGMVEPRMRGKGQDTVHL
jgi:hypothetical protein